MCEHVHICVLFMCKLLDLIMPERCQTCKKTNQSQLKKFLCWFYSFKYFRGKLLGSSKKDFFWSVPPFNLMWGLSLLTCLEATKLISVLLSVFTLIEAVCCKIYFGHNVCPRCNMFTSVPHCVVCETLLKQNTRY